MKSEKLFQAIGEINEELVADAALESPAKRPRLRRVVMAAAAAALALALTVGAGAVTGTFQGLEDLFAPAFRIGEDTPPLDMEIVEKLGHPVGVSTTNNGVTFTVESILRDRYSCSVIASVESNALNSQEIIWNWAELTIGGMDLGLGSGGTIASDSDSNAVRMVLEWESQEPIPDGDAVLTVRDLCVNPHRFLREKTIQGTWELEFDAGYEDVSLDLPAGQTVDVEGTEIVLDKIFISPMSVKVNYTADLDGLDLEKIVRTEPYDMALRWRLECLDIVITTKDGTRFYMTEYHLEDEDGGGNTQSGNGLVEKQADGWKGFCSMRFDQMLPLDEIASLTVEGVEIDLGAGK